MKKKVLVTGANGFIGKNLVDLWKRKSYQVDTYDRNTKFKNLEKYDAIVHLAGIAKANPDKLVEANLVLTVNLLESLSRIQGKKPRLIFASSFAVYNTQDKLITEKTNLFPRNMYGWTKKWTEEAILDYSDKFGIYTYIFRISNVFGPSAKPDQSVVATFIDLAKKNNQLLINGHGNQKRDFIYIDDLLKAIELAIDNKVIKGRNNMVVNICSGKGVTINDIVDGIKKFSNGKVIVKHKLSRKEKGFWVGDNTKAKKLLGWSPKISFSTGLRKLWQED